MSHEQVSAIETETNNTTTMQEEPLAVPRRVELLVMTQQTLRTVLAETSLSLDLEALLPAEVLSNPESSVVVMATMETGDWPKDPPPVEERRMITAVSDTSVLAQPDAFIASGLAPDEVAQEVAVLPVSGVEVDALVEEGLRLDSGLDGGATVTGVVEEGLRTGGSARAVRRSLRQWHHRPDASLAVV
jgi:hypothetical protein